MKVNKNKRNLLPLNLLTFFVSSFLFSTLASCDQSWANITPIMCGDSNYYFDNDYDPFKNFREDNSLVDKDGQSLSYLPSNYAFLRNKDNKFANYGYTSPVKNWYDANNIKKHWSTYDTNSLGWYLLEDENFQISHNNDSNKKIVNFHNCEVTRSISIVNTIAQAMVAMIDGAFSYQQSFLDINDTKSEKIALAWGVNEQSNFTFSHGTNDSNENRDFFELVFANSNFHIVGKSNVFFKTSAMNFNFMQDSFPFATYIIDENDSTKSSGQFTSNFKKLLEGGEFDSFDSLNVDSAHWSNKITAQQESFVDNHNNEYSNITKSIYQYDNVPIIIQPNSLIKTYLDPTRSASFLVNDFYQNDVNAIKKAIGDCWQKVGGEFVKTTNTFVPLHKTFNLKLNQPTTSAYKLSFANSKNDVDNRLPNEIFGNSFIALFNYNIVEYIDQQGNVIEQDYEPSFNTIFPSYFLDVFANNLFKSINSNIWILDEKIINDNLASLANLHNRVSEDGKQINPQDVNNKSLLSFLGYLFADNTGKIQTKNFIQPFESF